VTSNAMKITMMFDESEYRENLDSLKACNFVILELLLLM
jgi:hypothetical protein